VFDDLDTLVLGYGVKDRLGQVIFGTNTWHTKQIIQNAKKGEKYKFTIRFPADFGVGSYSVQTALVDTDTHLTANYEWVDRAVVFNVANIDKNHFAGLLWQEPEIKIQRAVE
jgi:lipopolysaccharide transport system ATP-binding protein